MESNNDLENDLVNNLFNGAIKLLFENLIEYGVNKIIEKAPVIRERFQNWWKNIS